MPPVTQRGMNMLPATDLGPDGQLEAQSAAPLGRFWTVWEACGFAIVPKLRSTSHTLLCRLEQNALHIPRPTWTHSWRMIDSDTELVFLFSLFGGILFYALQISSWGNLLSPPFPFCFPVLKSPFQLREAKIKSSWLLDDFSLLS